MSAIRISVTTATLVFALVLSLAAHADYSCARCGTFVVTTGKGYDRHNNVRMCGTCQDVRCDADSALLHELKSARDSDLQQARARVEQWKEIRDRLRETRRKRALSPDEEARLRSAEKAIRAYRKKVAELNELDQELRQEWADLKSFCPNIGSLKEGEPELPTGVDEFRTPEGAKDLLDDAGALGQVAHAPALDPDREGVWVVLVPTLDIDSKDAPKTLFGVSAHHKRRVFLVHLSQLGGKLREAAEASASQDYAQRFPPVFDRSTEDPPERDADPLDVAVISMGRAVAFVDAFSHSYARYQGAKAAGDVAAMHTQVSAMRTYARQARDHIATADAAWLEHMKAYSSALDATVAAAESGHVDLEKALSALQKQLAQGTDPKALAQLSAAGVSSSDVEKIRASIRQASTASLLDHVYDRRLYAELGQPPGRAVSDSLRHMWFGSQKLHRSLPKEEHAKKSP